MSIPPDAVCNKCCNPASMMCQRCHEFYCSSDCQLLDWKEHKSHCHQMPNLVPIRKMQLRSGRTANTTLNDSIQSETPSVMRPSINRNNQFRRNRGGHGYSDFGGANHRPLARNPLPPDQNDSVINSLLQDEDFTFKPKVLEATLKEHSSKTITNLTVTTFDVAWKIPFAPPLGEFFEAIVQWIEPQTSPSLVWITEMKYDAQLRKLLMEINRNIKKDMPCSVAEIRVGALVAAPLDQIFYRAEVLEIKSAAQLATVRLIDYGNELQVKYKKLCSSIPIMRNLNTYAVRVRLPKADLATDLKLESVISLRLLSEGDDGVYDVELKSKAKTISMDLPLDMLGGSTDIVLLKILQDGQKALFQFANFRNFDTKIDEHLDGDLEKQFDFIEQPLKERTFLAARTSKGWRRGCLLGYWPQKNTNLVYLMDEARIGMCRQLKKLPDEFLSHPMRVIAITVSSSSQTSLLDEEATLTTAAGKLTLRAAVTATPAAKNIQSLQCTLYANEQKISDVVASTFDGDLDNLGIKYWPEHISDGGLVYITRVLTQAEVFISSVSCKDYSDLFTTMAPKCPPFSANEEIQKDDVVLATLREKGDYFRAKLLTACDGSDIKSLLKVLDIDTGLSCNVPRGLARKPNLLVRSCPVYAKKVKLVYVDRIPTTVEDNKAIYTLQQCKENGVEFIVKHIVGESETVDLLLKTDHQQSLSKQLLPLLFERCTLVETNKKMLKKSEVMINVGDTELAVDTPLPPSPPDTPIATNSPTEIPDVIPPSKQLLQVTTSNIPNLNMDEMAEASSKIYTLDDLEIIPIPNGGKVKITVLDASTIGKGYITAADFGNKELLRQVDENLEKVKIHGKCPHLKKNYEPKTNEICLTLFDEDGEWYRALCVNVTADGKYHIMFLDYGNMSVVTKENILPITKDLMFPSNANLCFIENLAPNLTKPQLIAFINATLTDPILSCKAQRQEDDTYMIEVDEVEKYFA